MADTDLVRLDLDALVGGEVQVKVDGKWETFYADFCSADETHYQLIQARQVRHVTRLLAQSKAARDHLRAVAAAEESGEAPPIDPPEAAPFDESDPAFYANYERDLFGLLTRVWRASESSKPEDERVAIDEDYVRRKCNRRQAEAVLSCLWLSRLEPRVSAPAPTEAPAETLTAKQPRRRGKAA